MHRTSRLQRPLLLMSLLQVLYQANFVAGPHDMRDYPQHACDWILESRRGALALYLACCCRGQKLSAASNAPKSNGAPGSDTQDRARQQLGSGVGEETPDPGMLSHSSRCPYSGAGMTFLWRVQLSLSDLHSMWLFSLVWSKATKVEG